MHIINRHNSFGFQHLKQGISMFYLSIILFNPYIIKAETTTNITSTQENQCYNLFFAQKHVLQTIYEKLPSGEKAKELVIDEEEDFEIITSQNTSGETVSKISDRGNRGSVIQKIEPIKNKFHLTISYMASKLDSSSKSRVRSFAKINHLPKFHAEKDISTITLASLLQLKYLNIPYGALASASVKEIINPLLRLELVRHPIIANWRKKHPYKKIPAELIERAIPELHSFNHIRNTLEASGHIIKGIKVKNIKYYGIGTPRLNYEKQLGGNRFKRIQNLLGGINVETYKLSSKYQRDLNKPLWEETLRNYMLNLEKISWPKPKHLQKFRENLADKLIDKLKVLNPHKLENDDFIEKSIAFFILQYFHLSLRNSGSFLHKNADHILYFIENLNICPEQVFGESFKKSLTPLAPLVRKKLLLVKDLLKREDIFPRSLFQTVRTTDTITKFDLLPGKFDLEIELMPQ